MNPRLAHQIWLNVQKPEYKRFVNNCQNPSIEQEHVLQRYVRRNSQTEFGISHSFHKIHSYKDFIQEVPIREYKDFEGWIQKIANGQTNILTKSPVIGFEETSGTTSFSKIIPYTSDLKQEFEKGIAAWLVSLHSFCPNTFQGSAYWALSPATKATQKTASGLPIGIEDDREYFHPLVGWVLGSIMAVPSSLKREKDPQKFYRKTLESLLSREDLSFISIWSPTFFLQLDRFLQSNKQQIINWLKNESDIKNRRRINLLAALESDFVWKDLWPNLSVISCWKDTQSEWWTPEVQKRAGDVLIQGKGLLSTEGITSIPIESQLDPVLAVRSHFYEFRSVRDSKIYLAQEVSIQEIYEVILTTAGGLYRYSSGDLIEVTGFYKKTPCLRFIGRKDQQSDLVGEKLSEHQVLESFKILKNKIEISLAFLYPTQRETKVGYTLFIENNTDDHGSEECWRNITEDFEKSLYQNPYYQQAVNIGQLEPLKVSFLSPGFRQQLVKFLKDQSATKESTIKVPVLFARNRLKSLLGV